MSLITCDYTEPLKFVYVIPWAQSKMRIVGRDLSVVCLHGHRVWKLVSHVTSFLVCAQRSPFPLKDQQPSHILIRNSLYRERKRHIRKNHINFLKTPLTAGCPRGVPATMSVFLYLENPNLLI